MRVFVLCTGRCGSKAFAQACAHITNFTAAHESRTGIAGPDRVTYPDNHIEVDNRLSWMLGRLDETYGNEPLYVHLTRNPEEVARSYLQRLDSKSSIARAYWQGILTKQPDDPTAAVRDMVETVNANIRYFLRDKPNVMAFRLEEAQSDFSEFWGRIEARGDFDAATAELSAKHNSTEARNARKLAEEAARKPRNPTLLGRMLTSISRI